MQTGDWLPEAAAAATDFPVAWLCASQGSLRQIMHGTVLDCLLRNICRQHTPPRGYLNMPGMNSHVFQFGCKSCMNTRWAQHAPSFASWVAADL